MQSKRKNTIFAVMKPRNLFIGLVFLLAVLTACDATTREARRMVKRAERLADTLPDSTARLIDSVLRMPASFRERERMDMALLQAEALFGDRGQEISPVMDDDFFDDRGNVSTSPELERAAAYYARKEDYGKAAHAALYSGFVQQHYDEKEAAMRSFKEAEEYGELAGDSLAMAFAEYCMGKMLYNDYMEQEAMDLLQKSERFIGNHFLERASIENSKAVVFMIKEQYDSSELCLQQSIVHAEKGHSDKVRRKILYNHAVLYRIQGKYDQTIQCLRQIEGNRSFDGKELLLVNLNLGNVYFDKGQMDSANYYYKKTEALIPTTKATLETQDSLALLYRERHEDILYAVMQQRQEQTIYRIQQQYDYDNLQNELNRKIILRHRIILIISLLLLSSTIIIIFLQLRHKQMMEAEAEMKRQIDNLKKDLQEAVKTSYQEQELSSYSH